MTHPFVSLILLFPLQKKKKKQKESEILAQYDSKNQYIHKKKKKKSDKHDDTGYMCDRNHRDDLHRLRRFYDWWRCETTCVSFLSKLCSMHDFSSKRGRSSSLLWS